MAYFLLFLAGILAYIVSTLAGGGGAILLLPIAALYLSPAAIAPVVNLGNLIGRPARLVLFWKHIDWSIVWYYSPSALLGAVLGGLVFIQLDARWIQGMLGVFLILMVIPYRFGKKARSFKMKKAYFIPLGLIVSFISTLFGATGAILNPFYLNMGLIKESLIATKTANSFFVGLVQIGTYSFLGALHGKLYWYGLIIGLGAIIGNIIGKRFLQKLSDEQFRKGVLLIMLISGVLLLKSSLTN